jgi:hypothetical protein
MRIIPLAGCALIFWCPSVTGQEYRSNSLATETVEQDALKVLNDSDWAHTVKPSLQDTPCTFQNAVFPDLYPKDQAFQLDLTNPSRPPDPVKADDFEYLIRFQSAKPVQTAVQELLAIGEKWSSYRPGHWPRNEHAGPTDVANGRYNVADMITVAVILKRSAPDGTSLFNYGFARNGQGLSGMAVRRLEDNQWASNRSRCARRIRQVWGLATVVSKVDSWKTADFKPA